LTKPNATVMGREQIEENQLHQLSIALKQQLLKERIHEQNAGRTSQQKVQIALQKSVVSRHKNQQKSFVTCFRVPCWLAV
jgi:hypothetical protein